MNKHKALFVSVLLLACIACGGSGNVQPVFAAEQPAQLTTANIVLGPAAGQNPTNLVVNGTDLSFQISFDLGGIILPDAQFMWTITYTSPKGYVPHCMAFPANEYTLQAYQMYESGTSETEASSSMSAHLLAAGSGAHLSWNVSCPQQ
jgi:hypothetical protein